MSAEKPAPATIEELMALLRQLAAQDGAAGVADPLRPWQESFLQAPALDGRLSATDRLSWWFRPAPAANPSANRWDAFFDQTPPANPPPIAPPAPPATEPTGWTGLRLLLAEPEEALAEAEAEAVVDCLYDFVHAVGRRDINGAMAFIADDYHVMEDDVEVDALRLRQQLERLVDSLRDWEFTIALVEIPYPILHPDGILIYAQIQIDARHKNDGRLQTILYHRLAVFQQEGDGTWRISALSPVE